MIRPNIKIGIVYSSKSKKYVEELKSIITKNREEGYPIEAVVIDETSTAPERSIDERVFSNLARCSFAIVFLTKDISISDETYQFVSKPNVLIELGFFKQLLNDNAIWCIIDFPYSEITNNVYMMPSDIPAEICEELDNNNFINRLNVLFDKFLKVNKIIKLKDYNANDLVGSLILNADYKTEYGTLFTPHQLSLIEKYSLKCQLEEILNIWINEKENLNDVEQIIYLFERVVLMPFFTGKIDDGKINSFLSVELVEKNTYVSSCYHILIYINEYQEYRRQPYEDFEFYMNKAKEIETELNMFNPRKIAPIIECVAKNYIGLNYLNSYFTICKSKRHDEKKKIIGLENLSIAKDFFTQVIKTSIEALGDNLEIFQAYAKYNLARAKKCLGENASAEYNDAIMKRKKLSKISNFPETFRINFFLEKILAELDYYEYLLEQKELDYNEYEQKVDVAKSELEKLSQAPIYISLYRKLNERINKSKKIEKYN